MGTYTGNPAAGDALADPPVFNEVADGQNRKAASVNPQIEQIEDAIAAYIHYGAKQHKTNVFNAAGGNAFQTAVAFQGLVTLGANTRRATPFALSDVADQTINPNTQATNYYLGVTTAAGSRIVRLDTANVNDGDWLELLFTMAVGAGVWKFRRGADDTHEICTLDSSLWPRDEAMVSFQRRGALWHLASVGPAVIPGTYA